jgi:hypothetical protein
VTLLPPPAPEPAGVVPSDVMSMVKSLVSVMPLIGNVPLSVPPLKAVAPEMLMIESCVKPWLVRATPAVFDPVAVVNGLVPSEPVRRASPRDHPYLCLGSDWHGCCWSCRKCCARLDTSVL